MISSHSSAQHNGFATMLTAFSNALIIRAQAISGGCPASFRYLLPAPENGSACKRLCMYFRWMVRDDDGIDCGVWKQFSPSNLIIPVDTHILRVAQKLGLTRRKSADWKTAEEITAKLRTVCPEDPVKYDFSLCRYGMAGKRGALPLRSIPADPAEIKKPA